MDALIKNYAESAGSTQSFTPKDLVQRAFESNRTLQDLLTKHAEAVEKELEEAQKLLVRPLDHDSIILLTFQGRLLLKPPMLVMICWKWKCRYLEERSP